MNANQIKQSGRKKRLAKALRDNLKKRKVKERQLQPKNGKSGSEIRS